MTQEEAMKIAETYLAAESAEARVEFGIATTKTLEKPVGWVFFYDTKEYLATGNDMKRAVGNAPFIVDRVSGKIDVAGTDRSIAYYISQYERFGSSHPVKT